MNKFLKHSKQSQPTIHSARQKNKNVSPFFLSKSNLLAPKEAQLLFKTQPKGLSNSPTDLAHHNLETEMTNNIVLRTYLTYPTLFRVAEQPIVKQKVKPYNSIIGISNSIPIRMLTSHPTHLIIPSNIEIKGTRNHSPQLKQVFGLEARKPELTNFNFYPI